MKLSLIYTTFGRGNQLQRSLQRLQHLTLPYEIIIVDDGSQDNTYQIVQEEGKKLKEKGVKVKYLYRDHPIYDVCSIPRNIALKQATGDVFVTCEPECLFVTDVLKELEEYMNIYPNHVITAGLVYFTNPDTEITPELLVKDPLEQMKSWDIRPFPNGFHANYPQNVVTRFEYPTAPFVGCYEKYWLEKVGGWDEDMAIENGGGGYGFDDTDLLTRLREKGFNQVRENHITIIHQWHTRPYGSNKHGNTADGWAVNEKIMGAKNNTFKNSDGSTYTKIKQEELVANKNREYGSMSNVTEKEI